MNGVLIINKPKGYTSHDVVNVIRKKLDIKKVGHTGTLDPNATGVLPILIGQATKISKYLIEHDKTYVAEIKLGEKSSTGDLEGEIVEKCEVPSLDKKEIINVLNSFLGKQSQIPPVYSAIKVNGKKAYEYARSNKSIELQPRKIEIYQIELIEFKENLIKFQVSCSKGTYIRVLCEDIANKLGTVGLMQNLSRICVDKFKIEDSINVDEIEKSNIIDKLISIEKIFNDKGKIILNDNEMKSFLNGVKLKIELQDDYYRVYNNSQFIGLGIINNNFLKRDVVIRRSEVRS